MFDSVVKRAIIYQDVAVIIYIRPPCGLSTLAKEFTAATRKMQVHRVILLCVLLGCSYVQFVILL